MDISFIILNYYRKGLVKNCLRSILNSDLKNLNYEVIVIDNGSFDGVKAMLEKNFTNIKFIQSQKNVGMGAGNNLGIRVARGKYLMIMNPDVTLRPDAVQKMIDYLDKNAQIGLLGPKLINPDGTLQYTRCRFPEFLTPVWRRTPLQKLSPIKKKLEKFTTRDQDYNIAGKADWLHAACVMVRRNLIERIGGFDENFFLGFEDTDLCRRVWQANSEVWYYPESVVIHYPHRFSGSSSNWLSSLTKKNVRIHIASWLKYFWKYRRKLVGT